MKTLRQITKVILTDSNISVACITKSGTSMALKFDLKDNVEMKNLVEAFAKQLILLADEELNKNV